jgi:hypothetical protein
MALPGTFRKAEVVAIQHVMEETKSLRTLDRVKIRHVQQKIVIRGRPYRESLTAQISEVSLFHSHRVHVS